MEGETVMLNVFICEDDHDQRKRIAECISKFILMEDLDVKVALSAGTPDEILEYLRENKAAGLYFLDVNLNSHIDGISLAEKIRVYDPRGFIVFVTTYAETLPLTFQYKVEALDFIMKEDLHLGARICDCIRNAYAKYTVKTSRLQNNFVFKISDNRTISLDCSKILYFESSQAASHKIVVYSEDSAYDFYGKLSGVQKELDTGFFRCHRSFIVNLAKITEIDAANRILLLADNSSCFVSARQIQKIKSLLHGRVV
jgi:two-component system response regulator AgrA